MDSQQMTTGKNANHQKDHIMNTTKKNLLLETLQQLKEDQDRILLFHVTDKHGLHVVVKVGDATCLFLYMLKYDRKSKSYYEKDVAEDITTAPKKIVEFIDNLNDQRKLENEVFGFELL